MTSEPDFSVVPPERCTDMVDIHALAKARAEREGPQRMAVASAGEPTVIAALADAVRAGYVAPVLFGDAPLIGRLADAAGFDLAPFEVVHCDDRGEAGRRAVQATSSGDCALLMKGYIQTAALMREVLDKDHGLRSGRKLSHVLVIDAPRFDRLLLMSDGALNILPDLPLKIEIVKNAVEIARLLGIDEPRVALLAAIETVDVAQRASIDTAIIAKMADRGQIRGALVDGPLALDNAIDAHAARVKRIKSEVAGRADVLIVDNIDVGNVFYKSLVYFARAQVAGVIAGARAPLVLTSRADSAETKFNSIALGCVAVGPGASDGLERG